MAILQNQVRCPPMLELEEPEGPQGSYWFSFFSFGTERNDHSGMFVYDLVSFLQSEIENNCSISEVRPLELRPGTLCVRFRAGN